MKERIEELAQQAVREGMQYVRPGAAISIAITTAVNEALELAARECEKESFIGTPSMWVTASIANAAAIRKLKVE